MGAATGLKMKANWVLILIVMAIAAVIGGGAGVMSRERKPAPEVSGEPVEKAAPVPAPAPKVVEPPAAAVTQPPSPAIAQPAPSPARTMRRAVSRKKSKTASPP